MMLLSPPTHLLLTAHRYFFYLIIAITWFFFTPTAFIADTHFSPARNQTNLMWEPIKNCLFFSFTQFSSWKPQFSTNVGSFNIIPWESLNTPTNIFTISVIPHWGHIKSGKNNNFATLSIHSPSVLLVTLHCIIHCIIFHYINLTSSSSYIYFCLFLYLFRKKYVTFCVYILRPPPPLCVLHNLLIKPALCELLTLVHQLEEAEVLFWIYMSGQDVLVQAQLW